MKKVILVLILLASIQSFAQRRGDLNEGRISSLENQVRDLDYRLRTLELNGGANRPRGYYCIAQCKGNNWTQAGGKGASESEAKQAAFEAVRKNWSCNMEVVECSQEL